jgi:cyclophilin family peptidyl-prolyl cis-trans isomerase
MVSLRLLRNLAFALVAIAVGQTGCAKKDVPAVDSSDNPGQLAPEANQSGKPVEGIRLATDIARYNESFEDAVVTEVLDGQQPPPDTTIAGKPAAKLREDLENIWPTIPLLAKGMPITYVLTVETEEGVFEITLNTSLVPNHVRNFVALAKIGYYDGLRFDRLIHQTSEDKSQRTDLIIAGCPAGTGDDGIGHLGYTVKPQENTNLKHEEGTVGFWWEGTGKNAAGCRFYITLGRAPTLDGFSTIVGKVTSGLDVVKKIAAKPVKGTMEPESQIPVSPTVMKKVTVRPDPLEKTPPIAQNSR